MQIRKSIFILSVCALLLPTLAGAYPAEVSRTGQTTSYAANDDAGLLAGVPWPDPRFSERADGTISDNLTGLVWAKNANLLGTIDADNDTDVTVGDGRVTWQHALDYIKKLNRESYLGHSDWRLPNVNELESLVHAGVYNPALPTNPFSNVQSYYYWSSTSYASGTYSAWVVGMNYGYVINDYKTNSDYVWPVRSEQCGSFDNSIICLPKTGQTTCYNTVGDTITCTGTGQDGELQEGFDWPDPRFSLQSDNHTVTDNLTGLVWAKNANLMVTHDPAFDADDTANDGMITWQHALDYVAKLNIENYLNHTDWRLPNRRELRSLADYAQYDPALPIGNPFTGVQPYFYWSSTSHAYVTDYAWVVDLGVGLGLVYNFNKTNCYYVWPVRSGQVGNPIIITTTTTAGSTTTSIIFSTTTTSEGGSTTTSISSGNTTTTTVATTTTTTVSGPCPAKNALGENNPNLENLRYFRDSRLAQSAVGRKVIQIYYNNADSINAALERSPALQAFTRRVLQVIAPMVGKN